MVFDLETYGYNPVQKYTVRILKPRNIGKTYDFVWIDDYGTVNWNVEKTVMDKIHYQHFVRLNNRRRTQKVSTLTEFGYPFVKVSGSYKPSHEWCKQNLKPGSFVHLQNTFWFAYEQDAVLFKMHWL